MSSGWMRFLLVACGTLCVALGVIGIFLPLMPTTVFLLLAIATGVTVHVAKLPAFRPSVESEPERTTV